MSFLTRPSTAPSRSLKLAALVAACGIGLVTTPAFAQFVDDSNDGRTPLEAGLQPNIEFEKIELDLGELLESEKKPFEFKFRNTGNAALKISQVVKTCGCTKAEADKTEYAPGEVGYIRAEYDPSGKHGVQAKSIRVISNDPDRPDFSLLFRTKVLQLVSAEPRMLNFAEVQKGAGGVQQIKVTGRKADFAATLATVQRPDIFEVKVVETKPIKVENEELRETTLEVRLLPTAPVGRLNDSISIRTNDERMPLVNVAIGGNIAGDLRLEPAVMSFGVLKPGDPFSNQIKVLSKTGKPFKILKAEVKKTGNEPPNSVVLNFAFDPADPANPTTYTVKTTGNAPVPGADGKSPPPMQGVVVLTTDMPQEETVQIPFYGQLRMTPTQPTPAPAPAPAPAAPTATQPKK